MKPHLTNATSNYHTCLVPRPEWVPTSFPVPLPWLGCAGKSPASPPSQGTGPGNEVAASLLKVGPPLLQQSKSLHNNVV